MITRLWISVVETVSLRLRHGTDQWSRPALVFLCLILGVGLTANALEAQASHRVSTSISLDERGVPVADTIGAGIPAHDPSHVLVHFRRGPAADFLPGSGPARPFPGNPDLFLVEKPSGLSVAEAVRQYQAKSNVLYAEPDFLVQTFGTPADPLWSQQWDMANISCPTAWDGQTDAGDVIVAILDTGIDFTHPDLQSNLWVNPSDGSHGFTCMGGSCVAGGSDDFGHGTHVAGTIGAAANNDIGIAGINWKVQLMSLKFLGSNGSGSISDAILCFQKVTALKQQGFNIRLTSNSWGGGGFSQALKDAIAQAESAGVAHVCAAGNSGQNADALPMYPAAYDNRGIISVLASDQDDAGAYFTNYGLASVDIAAPGVSTLSTVPTGTCQLCDPSGYNFLSGTSMATPHVSGVLAALFSKNPALTPNEARDTVLDPESYDTLSDPKAQSTSTGGRLNLAKALSNPLLFAPKLNNFPVLTMAPDVFASAGSQINLSATVSDADGDIPRVAWNKAWPSVRTTWLFGHMLDTLFPDPIGDTVSFMAPSLVRTATVLYDVSVADGRGGGAHGRDSVTVSPVSSPGPPPAGTLTVSPTDAPAGSTISVAFPATDSQGAPAMWDLWVGYKNGACGTCCFTTTSTTVTVDSPGVYRFSTQAMDSTLNLSPRQSVVVRIGGASGEPPIASARLDKQSGPVPLTVSIDMSGSSDPDGTIQYYFVDCGSGSIGTSSPRGSCTFSSPGTYWILLQVQDNSGNVDAISAYAVATPPPPPTVSMTSPTPGSTVSGNVSVAATVSGAAGIRQVAFYRDGGVLLGTATASPYAITWDSTTAPLGSHTIYAIATDNAGSTGTSSSYSVTVSAPTTPQVTLTSPADGSTVQRKAKVTLQASATATANPISRVDFVVGSTVVCSDRSSPYSCIWQVPAKANTSYQIYANAYDTAGQVGVSPSVTITAK